MKQQLALLFTPPIEKHEPNTPAELGEFNMPVEIDRAVMKNSGSPKEYFFKEIAVHLAQAMVTTGVPREYWYIKFPPEVQRMFNLPESTKMSQ